MGLQEAAPATAAVLPQATVSHGLTALMVIAVLTGGVLVPKHLFDAITENAAQRAYAAGASLAGRQLERRAPDSK